MVGRDPSVRFGSAGASPSPLYTPSLYPNPNPLPKGEGIVVGRDPAYVLARQEPRPPLYTHPPFNLTLTLSQKERG